MNLPGLSLAGLSTRSTLIALAALCAWPVSSARAVTTNWNVNSGNFTVAGNWDNGVPDSDDTAVFNRGFLAYEVSFPGGSIFDPPPNHVIDRLRVHTNEVSFVKAFAPFQEAIPSLTVDNPATDETNRGIIIGEFAQDVAIVNMALSDLSAAAATVGEAAGSIATLNVARFNLTGSHAVDDELIIGNHGTGSLNVGAGQVVNLLGNLANAVIGKHSGSSGAVTIDGFNSRLTATQLDLGGGRTSAGGGMGTLMITNGGAVGITGGGFTSASIGTNSGGSGTVTVDGPGSTWNAAHTVIGYSGSGTLNVQNGGAASGGAFIGSSIGSTGVVNVTGAGSSWHSSGDINIGFRGTGTLTIQSGGVASGNSSIQIGVGGGSDGTATVTGAGSTWNSGYIVVGGNGMGTLTIADGGTVVTSLFGGFIGTSNLGDDGVGMVTVDGPGSTWTSEGDFGDLFVGETGLGTLNVTNGGAVSFDDLVVEARGIVAGNSAIAAKFTNGGQVWPGLNPGLTMGVSPGALDIDGSYLQSAAGSLNVRLGGTTPGTGYSQLQVSGAVTLAGGLSVLVANSFAPFAGDSFDILDWGSLSGTFSSVQLPPLANGLSWDTSQLYTTGAISVVGTILRADFDEDGDVDGNDLADWRAGFGTSGTAVHMDGDADGDFDVDGGDFLAWQRQLGSGMPGSLAAVPEPATLPLMALAATAACLRRRLTTWRFSATH